MHAFHEFAHRPVRRDLTDDIPKQRQLSKCHHWANFAAQDGHDQVSGLETSCRHVNMRISIETNDRVRAVNTKL